MNRATVLAVFAAFAMGCALLLDRTPALPAVAPLARSVPSEGCVPSGLDVKAGSGRVDEHSASLYTNGFVTMHVCDRGILSFVASGSPSLGRFPHLLVSLADDPLWEGEVSSPVEVSARVERPGWITIGFLNDLATGGEDRNLTLEEIRFVPMR